MTENHRSWVRIPLKTGPCIENLIVRTGGYVAVVTAGKTELPLSVGMQFSRIIADEITLHPLPILYFNEKAQTATAFC